MEAIVFTDAEYEYFLEDQKWAREETCHLLELCHRFDLRFLSFYC